MRLDLATLFSDPALMMFGFEGDHVRFAPMTRATFERSIFHDRRVEMAGKQLFRVPLDPLLRHQETSGLAPPRLNFIHHMAQTGSTLLARALDVPGRDLVIREPLPPRQLGVSAGAGADPSTASPDWRALLQLSLTMLGKRFDDHAPVVVKGNVPTSLIAGAIADADPGQAGILLYLGLEDYCAAVLRTPAHRQWLEAVTAEIKLAQDPCCGDFASGAIGEKAAALWAALIGRFQRLLALHPAFVSLDANNLFDRPVETILGASELFSIGLSRSEVEAIVSGRLFSTHAKNPALAFDASARSERRRRTLEQIGDEISAARRWLERNGGRIGLQSGLDRPLIGASPARA